VILQLSERPETYDSHIQAMKQGHGDIARIYAQNAVRKQNEKLNLLKLSSRVDAVAGRVQTAVTMRQITGNMMKVNRSLDVAMKSMSPERVSIPVACCALKFKEELE
jgi:charged multivesicular body protein 1